MNPIAFPWPPHGLNPNHKVHWAVKARVVKTYKQWCNTCLMAHKVKPMNCARVKLSIKFIPPDMRHRDTDNCLASIKSLLDCVSNAIGIDDSKFEFSAPVMDKPDPKGLGAVVVMVEPIHLERQAA